MIATPFRYTYNYFMNVVVCKFSRLKKPVRIPKLDVCLLVVSVFEVSINAKFLHMKFEAIKRLQHKFGQGKNKQKKLKIIISN